MKKESLKEEILNQLKKFQNEIKEVKDLKSLDELKIKYLGRKTFLGEISNYFKELTIEERKEIGKIFNEVKNKIEELYQKTKNQIEEKINFDFYHPGLEINFSTLTLISSNFKKITDIFSQLGFLVLDSPLIVSEYENFDSLNIPEDHPARDMWDTIWLKEPKKYLFRTHTSSFQVNFLKKYRPPVRGIVPGKVFRFEATDARHDFEFYQIEGISVSKLSNFSHLRYIFEKFFEKYFEKKVELRFRPSYFPFTEPSIEVDISCVICNKSGCPVCKYTGWLEVAGAGMIHPFVLKEANIDSKQFQGYAFGTGLERLIMLKYKINDIRILHSPDLRANEVSS